MPQFQLTLDLAFFGIQGSGKSTQAEIVIQKTGAALLYFGQAIRDRIAVGDDFAKKINKINKQGLPQPPENLTQISHDFFTAHPHGHIIFDTPIRSFIQKSPFEEMMKNKKRPWAIIHLTLDEAISKERMSHQTNRTDDSPEAIETRLRVFREDQLPALELFKKEGKIPIIEIDATPPIEEIAKNLEVELLKQKFIIPS